METHYYFLVVLLNTGLYELADQQSKMKVQVVDYYPINTLHIVHDLIQERFTYISQLINKLHIVHDLIGNLDSKPILLSYYMVFQCINSLVSTYYIFATLLAA